MEIGIWFGLLILFGILEAVTVSVVSIWFMAGSLAAILAALCGASLPVQIVLFLAVSVALLACLRPLVRKYVSPKITATNADRVIGKTAVVTESIDNIAAQGAVKVGGVECSEATIKDGTYEIQRPFLMVTLEGAELSPAAEDFLSYATSADVAEYIAAAGAVAP